MAKLVQSVLTGVSRNKRSHLKLKEIYRRSLLLLQKLPKDSAYRMNTEAIINFRMSVVTEACDNHKQMEENIGGGRLELLISQAEAEYKLLQKVILCKIWEPLVQRPPKGQWDWPPSPT